MIRFNTNLMKQKLNYSFKVIEDNSERLEEKDGKNADETRENSRASFN